MKKGLPKGSTNPLAAFALAALLFGPAVESRAEVFDVIPYGAGDYRYQIYPDLAAVPADWAAVTFDDSGFWVGTMPFGSAAQGGAHCPLAAGANTYWPSPSVLLLRRTFELPADAQNVKIYLGIDNNARIAVNGSLLGPDWTRHTECPQRGDYFWDVPSDVLNTGGFNVLAVLAEDHGAESWIDLRMTVFDPPTTCGAATVTPGNIWSPNHKLFVPVTISVPSLADGTPPQVRVLGVTQDEPVTGPRAGHTSPDATIEGGVLKIRVERSGHGNGRMYGIHLSATFTPGGTCDALVYVCVPHSRCEDDDDEDDGGSDSCDDDDRIPTCVDDGQLYDSLQR